MPFISPPQGAQPGGTTFVTNINNNTFLTNSTTVGIGGAVALNNGANLSTMQVHFNRFTGNTKLFFTIIQRTSFHRVCR